MLKKVKYIISLLMIITIILFASKVYASSANISVNANSVTVGDTITITISGNAASWNLELSGAISGSMADVTSTGENENVTMGTYTYKTTQEGDVTFKLKGVVSDSDYTKENIDTTKTVTVKAKQNNNTGGGSTGGNTTPTEPKFTSVNETVYATTEVNVRKGWSTSSGILGSLEKGKSVTRIGKGDNGWSKVTFNGSTGYIYSEYLTTTKPVEEKPVETPAKEEKSTNKNLSKLEVKPEGLTPEFKKDVTDYTIKIANNIEKLEIKAEAEDSKAKVQITGNDKLVEGDNVIKIAVTAEDGTIRTYIITATKEKATATSSLRLATLTIENINLNPAFSPDIFDYVATLENKEITELIVNATTNGENAIVEVLGNKNLKDGENVITILVKSSKTNETTTYQITVDKKIAQEEKQSIFPKISAKEIFYIIAGIISLIILLKIIKRDKAKAKKDKQDFTDEKNEENTIGNEKEQNKKEYLENFGKEEEITNSENNYYEEEEEKEDAKRKKGKHF
ncbi:MAG: cadherin-like beta sandwich domain-containing protein [Clostridia bacterium]